MTDHTATAMEAIEEAETKARDLHEALDLLRKAELALIKFNQICSPEQLRSRQETAESAKLVEKVAKFLRSHSR